jgi:hypothetical protein
MKLKGNISILINRESTTIEIRDSEANTMFVEITLTPEQLSEVLSRMKYTACEIEVFGLDRVGKKHENKRFEFVVPSDLKGKRDSEKLREHAQTLLTDGWIADGYFSSQDSFFTKDGIDYARVTIRRWV